MTGLTTFDWRGDDAFDARQARESLRRDGAILVRGMLNPAEISQAREQVTARLVAGGERIQLGKTQPNAALLVPEIGWLVGHADIISVMRALLDDDICFTGHCDIHMNMLSGWHKDSGEALGGYFRGDYFGADDCNVYKAAVYLQDATLEDGLTVRLGSHRHSGHDGLEKHVDSKAGDVVFFDVRLSHVGQRPDAVEKAIKAVVRPLRNSNRTEPAWATSLKELYWKAIGRRNRLSVFFTYGQRNDFTVDFSKANMDRQHAQAGAVTVPMPAPLAAALDKSGIPMIELDAPAQPAVHNAEEPA